MQYRLFIMACSYEIYFSFLMQYVYLYEFAEYSELFRTGQHYGAQHEVMSFVEICINASAVQIASFS